MKIIHIALMLFLLHISAIIIDVTGIFDNYIGASFESYEWTSEVASANLKYKPTDDTSIIAFGQDFMSGTNKLFSLTSGIIARVLSVRATFIQFGVDVILATYMSLPVYILWVLGIGQFISNRSTSGMK